MSLPAPLVESTWIEPAPDSWAIDLASDPAEQAVARESLRLALIAALQHLPPRQRAVLILCEVLSWRANEVARLLDTTPASVNSALQRARAALARDKIEDEASSIPDETFLNRYVDAFQTYDLDSLVGLIKEDAIQSMPPYALWLRGRDHVLAWWFGSGASCRNSVLVRTEANGRVAFGQYRPSPNGGYEAWASCCSIRWWLHQATFQVAFLLLL